MINRNKKIRSRSFFRRSNVHFSKTHHLPLARFFKKHFPLTTSFKSINQVLFRLFPFFSIQTRSHLTRRIFFYLRGWSLLNLLNKFRVRDTHLRYLRKINSTSCVWSIPSESIYKSNSFSKLALVYPAFRTRYVRFPRTFDVFLPLLLFQSYFFALSPFTSVLTPLLAFHSTGWLSKWLSFVSTYGAFYETPQLQLYIRSYSNLKKPFKHFVRFRFKGPRLTLTLTDENIRETHFFLSPGLLLKYFQRQKALKKTKTLKFLLMKFLRKLLVILKLKYVVLHFKGVPVLIELLLQVLYQPISHPMRDPLSNRIIDETDHWVRDLNISKIMFVNPKPFGYLKTRKKGRIKRKIRRKIIRSSNVVDEM